MAMTGSGLGVWDWAVDTNSVWFSDTWQMMLGYEPGEVPQHVSSWQNAVHPDDWPIINAALEPHLAGLTGHYECEHRVLCKDGSWLWILDRGQVVKRDAEGRAVRMIGTHDNIQNRKEGEMYRSALLDLSSDLAELETVSHIVDRALITVVETLDVDFAAYTESESKEGIPRMARRWRSGRHGSSVGRWFGVRLYKDLARQLIRGETVAVQDLAAMDFTEVEDLGGTTDGEDLCAILVVPIHRRSKPPSCPTCGTGCAKPSPAPRRMKPTGRRGKSCSVSGALMRFLLLPRRWRMN
jgi:PAS domain S-box-containing protein